MLPDHLRAERRKVIGGIKSLVKPLLHATGYVADRSRGHDDPKRYVQAWVPVNDQGRPTMEYISLPGSYALAEFTGFTDKGVIIDAFGGGMASTSYSAFPLEDLYRLKAWAERHLPAALRRAELEAAAA